MMRRRILSYATWSANDRATDPDSPVYYRGHGQATEPEIIPETAADNNQGTARNYHLQVEPVMQE